METKPVNVVHASNNWYLLTGLLIGLAIGLVVSLLLVPLTNAEALPAELDPGAKAEYRLMIARAYVAQPNIQRAESRLALLKDPDPAGALVAQAQELLAAGGAEEDARALAHLSAMLSIDAPSAP